MCLARLFLGEPLLLVSEGKPKGQPLRQSEGPLKQRASHVNLNQGLSKPHIADATTSPQPREHVKGNLQVWALEVWRYCGWTKSISHHLRNPGMVIPPCKYQRTWFRMASKWWERILSIHMEVIHHLHKGYILPYGLTLVVHSIHTSKTST